jgi:cytochrome P450
VNLLLPLFPAGARLVLSTITGHRDPTVDADPVRFD